MTAPTPDMTEFVDAFAKLLLAEADRLAALGRPREAELSQQDAGGGDDEPH